MTKSAFSINYNLTAIRGEFFGGLTSMLITLPVALGLGVASGIGAAAGLYSAIAVGFFAEVFGGTRASDRVVRSLEMGIQLATECVGPPAAVVHST